MELDKQAVKDFWSTASCGENLYLKGDNIKDAFLNEMKNRYELEPYIINFAQFEEAKNKKVLEVGVGLGSDHQKYAENGAILNGIDLTERSVEYTKQRLELFGYTSKVIVADAENLPFESDYFDLVYSWGVIHHSPNTENAILEIYRVLKNGGNAKIMIYHKNSMVGYMLWMRYALLKLKPFTSLKEIYAKYLESPGTKAYTFDEAAKMCKKFKSVTISTVLTHADLLTSEAGQRHRGIILKIARTLYPRFIIRKLFSNNGLFMLIELKK